jgi:hypothetical protein
VERLKNAAARTSMSGANNRDVSDLIADIQRSRFSGPHSATPSDRARGQTNGHDVKSLINRFRSFCPVVAAAWIVGTQLAAFVLADWMLV